MSNIVSNEDKLIDTTMPFLKKMLFLLQLTHIPLDMYMYLLFRLSSRNGE